MKLQPVVRVILTALAAGIGAAATQIDNETLRIAAAVLVPTLAAIGIIPPQVPTRTVEEARGESSSRLVGSPTGRGEVGQGMVELVIAVLLILILVFVLLRVM